MKLFGDVRNRIKVVKSRRRDSKRARERVKTSSLKVQRVFPVQLQATRDTRYIKVYGARSHDGGLNNLLC